MFLASKENISFFVDVFNSFWGSYSLPILFVIILIILYKKKNEIINEMFIYPFVFLLMTVYNPFVMLYVLRVINISERYYRFYWLTPFALIIAVGLVDVLGEIKNQRLQLGSFAIVLMVCMSLGERNDFMIKKSNVYDVSQDAIDVVTIIEADNSDDDKKVFADFEIVYFLRLYSGSVLPLATRQYDMDSDVVFDKTVDEVYREFCESGKSYLVMANQDVEIEPEKVRNDLQRDGAEYFVRNKLWYSEDYMNQLGYSFIGESENYEVYKVE